MHSRRSSYYRKVSLFKILSIEILKVVITSKDPDILRIKSKIQEKLLKRSRTLQLLAKAHFQLKHVLQINFMDSQVSKGMTHIYQLFDSFQNSQYASPYDHLQSCKMGLLESTEVIESHSHRFRQQIKTLDRSLSDLRLIVESIERASCSNRARGPKFPQIERKEMDWFPEHLFYQLQNQERAYIRKIYQAEKHLETLIREKMIFLERMTHIQKNRFERLFGDIREVWKTQKEKAKEIGLSTQRVFMRERCESYLQKELLLETHLKVGKCNKEKVKVIFRVSEQQFEEKSEENLNISDELDISGFESELNYNQKSQRNQDPNVTKEPNSKFLKKSTPDASMGVAIKENKMRKSGVLKNRQSFACPSFVSERPSHNRSSPNPERENKKQVNKTGQFFDSARFSKKLIRNRMTELNQKDESQKEKLPPRFSDFGSSSQKFGNRSSSSGKLSKESPFKKRNYSPEMSLFERNEDSELSLKNDNKDRNGPVNNFKEIKTRPKAYQNRKLFKEIMAKNGIKRFYLNYI